MSWNPFASKTKIAVFSKALQLADPDDNLITKTIISGLLTGADITDGLTHLAFNGVSAHTDRMMNYARGTYTLGLPQGSKSETTVLDNQDVIDAIDADIPLTWSCALDFNFVTPLTHGHLAIPFLEKQRNYDILTGLLTEHPPGIVYPEPPAPIGNQVYIDSSYRMSVTNVIYNQDLETTDTATLTIYYDLETTHQYKTYFNDEDGELDFTFDSIVENQEETEDVQFTAGVGGYRFGQSYCIAKYRKEIDGIGTLSETTDWWFYDIAAETYPQLNYTPAVDDENTLMPVVPIRFENQDLCDVAHESTDLYKTSKKLLDKVGVDIQDLREAVNDNPDVGDIDHAYVMWGINLRDPSPLSIRYLAEFFDHLYDIALINQANLNNSLIYGLSVGQNQYVFGDFITPGGTSTKIVDVHSDWESNSYTITTRNTNNPISLEEQGLDVGIEYTSISSTRVNGSIGDVGFATMELTAEGVPNSYVSTPHPVDLSETIFRLQVTDSYYKEITIKGLTHYNRVYRNKTIWTTIGDVLAGWADDDDAEDNFVVPLHYGIARKLAPYERNYLYLEALHLIVNGYDKFKVKFYERGIFTVICVIILAVLFIFTRNPQFLSAAGTMLAFEVLSQILPADILAYVKVAYLLYAVVTFDYTALIDGTATAAAYLTAASMAIQVAQLPMDYRMLQLQGEFEDLAEAQQAEAEELRTAYEALDVASILDPGLLLNNANFLPMFFASPTDMFNLRIGNKNPGLMSIKGPEFYVANSLQLPDNGFTG